MNARREPVPKALEVVPAHIFDPVLEGPRDHRGDPIECRVVGCIFPKWNGVHVSPEDFVEELVADLPEKPEEDRSDEIIGERE